MTEPDQPRVERLPEAPDLPHRLGRHLHHDPQSRAYAFRATPGTPLRTVHWERAVPIFDQGSLGSCTGNAAAGWLGTANALRPGLTVAPDPKFPGAPPVAVNEALARDLYSEATEIDPYDGMWPPVDSGSDGLSVTKVLQQIGAVDSYQHAFDVHSVLVALQQGPVLIGTPWHEGMFDAAEDGTVTVSGPVVGGHEYLAVGYDVDVDEVAFANSWGTSWGLSGFFYMSGSSLGQLLADDGDATIPHALVVPPVPPGPDPGAAGFPVDLAPDVAAHVARLAARRGIEPAAWVNDRLRHYFGSIR